MKKFATRFSSNSRISYISIPDDQRRIIDAAMSYTDDQRRFNNAIAALKAEQIVITR